MPKYTVLLSGTWVERYEGVEAPSQAALEHSLDEQGVESPYVNGKEPDKTDGHSFSYDVERERTPREKRKEKEGGNTDVSASALPRA